MLGLISAGGTKGLPGFFTTAREYKSLSRQNRSDLDHEKEVKYDTVTFDSFRDTHPPTRTNADFPPETGLVLIMKTRSNMTPVTFDTFEDTYLLKPNHNRTEATL